MKINEHIEYWLQSAEHDLKTAESLFDTNHYDWCLYLGHLVLEKVIKAIYVINNQEVPPKSHDLLYLANKSKIVLIRDYKDTLEMATNFHLETRYPDEKLSFYKVCTKEYTEPKFNQIKEVYQWLKSQAKY